MQISIMIIEGSTSMNIVLEQKKVGGWVQRERARGYNSTNFQLSLITQLVSSPNHSPQVPATSNTQTILKIENISSYIFDFTQFSRLLFFLIYDFFFVFFPSYYDLVQENNIYFLIHIWKQFIKITLPLFDSESNPIRVSVSKFFFSQRKMITQDWLENYGRTFKGQCFTKICDTLIIVLIISISIY